MDGRPEGDGTGGPDDEAGGELDAGGLRGWIPPDDRLWRHPSESATAGPSVLWGEEPPVTRRSPTVWMVGGAACLLVVMVAVAGMALVANGTADQESSDTTLGLTALTGTPTTDPGLGGMAARSAIAAMVSEVRPSMVALRIEGSHGVTSTEAGLVAESGGIIVTASSALAGARSVTAIEADGAREPAQPVGIDRTTGLGVVRIDDDLPAATFDAVDPPVGDVAVATALDPGSPTTAPPASTVYAGTVVATGQAPTGSGSVPGFSATAVDAPLDRRDLGCALLDGSGHVAGILEATDGTGRDALAYFLPAQLVLGVTRQLVTSGTVEHGWLGLGSIDSAAPGGAAVTPSAGDGAAVAFVDPDSPAASAGLAAGDVIVDMNGEPVHSTAELRSMLYPEPPGSSMAVTFERAGVTRTVPVVLGEPEAADAGDDSSP